MFDSAIAMLEWQGESDRHGRFFSSTAPREITLEDALAEMLKLLREQ